MIFDVVFDSVSPDIADASAEFSRGPEVPLSENAPEAGKRCKKLMRRPALEKLECLGNTEVKREGYEQVDMVSCDVHVVDDNFVHLSSPNEGLLKETHRSWEFKGVFPVLWAPLKVKLI